MNNGYDVNTVHIDANFFAQDRSSLADSFDDDVYQPVDQPVLFNERECACDQQRRDAVDSGPKRLRHFLYILAIELSCLDAPPDCVAKMIETTFPGLGLVFLRNLFGLNKCN